MPRYLDIVESVTSLSLEKMQEVENILHRSVIETRRQQILQNQIESKSLYVAGRLKLYDYSSDL
ncbi:MAG: hypothetical protein ABI707_10405 [Ferruginibacter sp.]